MTFLRDTKRLYLAVAGCAVVVYLGALGNLFALDDRFIVVLNPFVRSPSGMWSAFLQPYLAGDLGGKMYRPLTTASFSFDWLVDGPAWFHAVNLLWHAGASVAVAALARRWSGTAAALVAGLLFAVHPVHVEAVANVVGRAELMATLFALLAVYAALVRGSVGWSTAALAVGVLSKENAAVAPGLIAWAWLLGIARPPRAKLAGFAIAWAVLAGVYFAVRWDVLHPFARYLSIAPAFVGAGPIPVRLTAVAALADVTRLLLFPLTLRADYSPAERTLVTTPLDAHFGLGLLCVGIWAALLVRAWRHGRRIEALGLGWIALAYLPVANLVFPVGFLIAERTLYLPSVGFALAAGAWLSRLPLAPRRMGLLVAVLVAAGGLRTALRVPVWRDDKTLTLSILDDSPRSFFGPWRIGAMLQGVRQPEKALDAFRIAARVYDRNALLYVAAADAAFTLGQPHLADSLLARSEQICYRCLGHYRVQAAAARVRGDSAVADSLLARARLLEGR